MASVLSRVVQCGASVTASEMANPVRNNNNPIVAPPATAAKTARGTGHAKRGDPQGYLGQFPKHVFLLP